MSKPSSNATPATVSQTIREILSEALESGTFQSLVLSEPRAVETQGELPSDGLPSDGLPSDGLKKVLVRPLLHRGENRFQFSTRVGKQETHENLTATQAEKRILHLLETRFAHARLSTTTADSLIRIQPGGATTVKSSPPGKRGSEGKPHNRAKRYLIPEGTPCPFLLEIGVMTAAGKVRSAKTRKFRQVNRFLELVDDVLQHLPSRGPLRLIDFGCGKSALTFALHHLLYNIRRRDVQLIGLDRDADVIGKCRGIAERLGCPGLTFERGDITKFETADRVDLVVCLHACDTATDDAIAKAIGWNAGAILAVPCCQHELAPQLQSEQLSSLTRHGILKERFAALATDALRAEILEACGYRTQIVEFIDMEHTAKNVLIRAVRRGQPSASASARERSLQEFKSLLGLKRIHLEEVLSPRPGTTPGVLNLDG